MLRDLWVSLKLLYFNLLLFIIIYYKSRTHDTQKNENKNRTRRRRRWCQQNGEVGGQASRRRSCESVQTSPLDSSTQTLPITVTRLDACVDAAVQPATVSRCGMIYLEPSTLGWRPMLKSWLNTLPEPLQTEEHLSCVLAMFDWLVDPCLTFVKKSCKVTTLTSSSFTASKAAQGHHHHHHQHHFNLHST